MRSDTLELHHGGEMGSMIDWSLVWLLHVATLLWRNFGPEDILR